MKIIMVLILNKLSLLFSEVKLMYYIFLEDYEGLYVVRTKEFNKQVEENLKWLLGRDHEVVVVVKNPEDIKLRESCYLTKERILADMEWMIEWRTEDEEEIQKKVEFIKSILV